MKHFNLVQFTIHPAGWPFIAIFAVLALILSALSCVLGAIGWVLTAWCVYFFRDPDRVTPLKAGLVIAPGDGVVQSIVTGPAPAEIGLPEGTYTRVSIFLSVFDVHINRAPIGGEIVQKTYIPGKFFNAALDKASLDNERLALRIKTNAENGGREIGVVQIAGLVARRIVSWVENGHALKTGERFGMIRFGSRVDTYLPEGIAPLVIVGQRAVGGETILADLNGQEPARLGEIR